MMSNTTIRLDAAVSWSLVSTDIDTKPTRRYPVTLDQARNRVLRAIRRNRRSN